MPVELVRFNIAHQDIGGLVMLGDYGWYGCSADGDMVTPPRGQALLA